MPTPPRLAVSLVAHVSPAPPRSWMPTTRLASSMARHASMSRFSSNGSPTCTLGRFAASVSSSLKPADGQDAEAEHVDERVVLIGLVEDQFAPNSGDTHRVPVPADTRDDALGDPPAARIR